MSYRLEYSDEAKRTLRIMPGYYRQIFRRAIEELAHNPRPANAEDMRDPNYFKIKLGHWRLIYHVRMADTVIRILSIGWGGGVADPLGASS